MRGSAWGASRPRLVRSLLGSMWVAISAIRGPEPGRLLQLARQLVGLLQPEPVVDLQVEVRIEPAP
jgi:hypothetical protein